MARHRRTPKKNRKKLKSVDPFNRNARSIREEKIRNKNFEPKSLDDQPLTRSVQNLIESRKEANENPNPKRKKRKNKMLQEAERLGMKKGRFETIDKFVQRVGRMMRAAVNEDILLAKKGLGGRDQAEIEKDYAKIEESEKKKKEQEKRTVENKIKEARKKREKDEAARNEVVARKAERKAMRKEMSDNPDGDDDVLPTKEAYSKVKISKQGTSMFKRPTKATKADDRNFERILNAIEVVPFGDRYDAPPTLSNKFSTKRTPSSTKAGSKSLLLHSLLEKKKSSDAT